MGALKSLLTLVIIGLFILGDVLLPLQRSSNRQSDKRATGVFRACNCDFPLFMQPLPTLVLTAFFRTTSTKFTGNALNCRQQKLNRSLNFPYCVQMSSNFFPRIHLQLPDSH